MKRTETKRNQRPPGHARSDFAIPNHEPDDEGGDGDVKDDLGDAQCCVRVHGSVAVDMLIGGGGGRVWYSRASLGFIEPK